MSNRFMVISSYKAEGIYFDADTNDLEVAKKKNTKAISRG